MVITIMPWAGSRYSYQNSWGSSTPASFQGATGTVFLGNYFWCTEPGFIVGARFIRDRADPGEHIAFITREADNSWVGITKFRWKPASGSGVDGWQHAYFRPQIPIEVGTYYNIMVGFTHGYFRWTDSYFTVDRVFGALTFGQDSASHWNGQYNFDPSPSASYNHSAQRRYGIDVLFHQRS